MIHRVSRDRSARAPEGSISSETSEPAAALHPSSIQRILPHRYPFLLVDRVTEFLPGKRIVGIKIFSANEPGACGHFPGSPVVPTGMLIEMVTQLGAVLALERPGMAGRVALVLQIPFAQMQKLIYAGDALRIEAEVVRLGEDFGEMRGAAYCQEELVAEGRMRFAIANAAGFLPERGNSR